MAIENLITDHLDLWSAAVRPKSSAGRGSNSKLELTGIKKLRELILELAVRGKLVPQDPSEEPTSVLLERIAAEKAQLVKEGQIKKPKALPEISEKEKPFELPSTWSWVRLNDIANYNGRPNVEPDNIKGDVWLLDLEDIEKNTSKLLYRASYEERESKSNKSIFKCGDVLYGKLRPYLNKVIVADLDGVCTTEIVPIVPSDGLHSAYLKYLLKSPAFQSYVNSLMYGVKMPRLGTEDAIKSIHPLPPFAEQHRIVAKVDELMALCDQLEQRSESQLVAHQTLVEALLTTLTDSCGAVELAQNWARLSTHFDTLFTTEASIDALKQTILQLAVMGKLVPQDPSDEPASALLSRIAAEKTWLVIDGKIKKPKALPEICEEDKPFELPHGWEWVRFGSVCHIERGGSPRPIKSFLTDSSDGLNWIKIGDADIGGKYITQASERIIPEGLNKTRKVYPGDFLLTNSMSFGRPYITKIEGCIHDGWLRISPPLSLDKDYLYSLLSSPFMMRSFKESAAGAVVMNLNADKVAETLIALPPTAQQHRIVAKVDELMTLCDQLKSRLQTSQQTQLALAESLVEGSLEDNI
ncbi:restriction endonuclease subunit S [Aeromonas allosaccharophila]